MKGFDDVRLSWKGEEYVIAADRIFDLVMRIEDIIMGAGATPAFVLLLQNRVSQSKLAAAYAEALRFAGAKVGPQEVYLSIMADFASNSAEAARKVQDAIVGLLCIISPPLAAEIIGDQPAEKKT